MRLTVKAKGIKEIIDNLKKYDEETQAKVGTVINNSLKVHCERYAKPLA